MPCAAGFWTCISRIGSTSLINLDICLTYHNAEVKPILRVLAQDSKGASPTQQGIIFIPQDQKKR